MGTHRKRAEVGVMGTQAKGHLGYQKLEEAWKDPYLEASEEDGPVDTLTSNF